MKLIPQYEPLFDRATIAKNVSDYIMSDGYMTEYNHTQKFEKEIAEFLGVKHCITVNNGTISLSLALLANGIKPGDKVIVPALSMIATANAVTLIGAIPVFVDIDTQLCLHENNTMKLLSQDKSIKAVIYVSLNGKITRNYEMLEKHCQAMNIALIEDNAQSFGSKYHSGKMMGNTGNISSFSFSMPKIICSGGQGGCLTTNNDELAQRLRQLKDFGRTSGGNDIHNDFGINSKFSIDGEEDTFIMESGKIKIEQIKNSMEKNFSVPAFDNNLKIKWVKCQKTIQHSLPANKKMYKLKLSTGREVIASEDHSIFILKGGNIVPFEVQNLTLGDYAIIPKKLPNSKQHIKYLNFKKILETEKIPYTVQNNKIYYLRQYLKGGNRKIGEGFPIKIKITEELMRFLGYYVAEGCTSNGCISNVSFATKERKYIKDVTFCFKKIFDLPFYTSIHINATQIQFTGGSILSVILKNLCGEGAKKKKIPSFVFNVSSKMKKEFLKAYFRGDGSYSVSKETLSCKTVSKKLASGLLYLFLTLKVIGRVNELQGKDRIIANNKKISICNNCWMISLSIPSFINILGTDAKAKNRDIFKPHCLSIPFYESGLKTLWQETKKLRRKRDKKGRWVKYSKFHNIQGLSLRKTICPKHALKLLKYIKTSKHNTKKIENLIKGDLAFAKILKITKIRKYNKKVFDYSVPGYENFVGGHGGILLHNTEIQAIIGLNQLADIEWRIKRKKEIYQLYYDLLNNVKQISFITPDLATVTPWFVDINVLTPMNLQKYLRENGIQTRAMYSPMNEQMCYVDHSQHFETFENAIYYSNNILWLPSSFTLHDKNIEHICTKIKEFYR